VWLNYRAHLSQWGVGRGHIFFTHGDHYLPRRGRVTRGDSKHLGPTDSLYHRLEPSGFTYDPNDFMKRKIFYFNFVWMKDFGETSMNNLLDMVKVSSS
jgi:hypothetical protein